MDNAAAERNTGRKALATDFYVNVDGVGRFRFARRTMRDEFKVGVEYSRLTEGVSTPTPWLAQMSTMVSNLVVLAVTVPANWDIDALDPLDDESYAKIIKVYDALRAQEGSFRRGNGKTGKKEGKSVSEDAAVLVQKDVPAITE